MPFLKINGGTPISGSVQIPGAKNAALPLFCAALLTTEKCTFRNVPEISDLENLLGLFEKMGASVFWDKEKKVVQIRAENLDPQKIARDHRVKKFRAALLMLGPLLARCGECEILRPGGCVLGARSNAIHLRSLEILGAEITETDEKISASFAAQNFKNRQVLLAEASVTGTENLALFAAGVGDECDLYFAATEPHVVALLQMLVKMGAEISGIGTPHVQIRGTKNLCGVEIEIPPDGILVGTYAIAGLLTGGEMEIGNVNHAELFSFYGILQQIGARFEMADEKTLKIFPSQNLKAISKVQTAISPGFPTDLQSPLGVLLTQCEGVSMIFETLFENRLTYLSELEKMGAKIEILNAHQAKITGKTPLQAAQVQSWDLRAGAAMVLAGLVAEGETQVFNIDYIDRGYENFAQNLARMGAKVERVE